MTTLSTWKDKSGKGNDFVGYSGKNKPKLTGGSQNGLDGVHFLYSDDSSMKLGTANLSTGPQTEINNCKTIFIVWKDLDNDKTTTTMSSKSNGPPPLLGSDATLGSGNGHTISDFGTSHGGTETFWATNGTHTAIKAGNTRINGGNDFTSIGTSSDVKRSNLVGTANLASVQISTGLPNTGYGDGAGDRVGVVLSGLGNSRHEGSYITNYVIYELIVYTGKLDGINRDNVRGGTTHGNVGGDTTANSDLISVEKYLQKKWNLAGADESASDTLPNVTSTNCILSLHLDSSNPNNLAANVIDPINAEKKTRVYEWKDLSGKSNHFVPYSSINLTAPALNKTTHKQNGLPGVVFDSSKNAGLKLNSADLSTGPQTEINNCKTIFMVWKDIDSSRMTSNSNGPPPLLASEASLGSGNGHTISDFGSSHGGTETFWATNGTHNALKAGSTRVNGNNDFTGIGTNIKRSSLVGSVNMLSLQINSANPSTGYGDGAGDRVGVVLSALGNARNHSNYNTHYVVYELIVYTGKLDGVNRSQNKGGTVHGNVGSDTLFSGSTSYLKVAEYAIDSSFIFKLEEATNNFMNNKDWNQVVAALTAINTNNSNATKWVKSIVTFDSKTLFRFDNQQDLHGNMKIKWGPSGFDGSSPTGFVNVTQANSNADNGIGYWYFDTTNFKLIQYKESRANSELISIEKYLKRKWGIGALDLTASTSLPDVTTTNCILSLHLDASNTKALPQAEVENQRNEEAATTEATDLGITTTALTNIKTGIPTVPSSGKVVLSTSLITNLKNNISGSTEQKRKKRASLIKLLFSQSTILKKMDGIKASDLSLPANFLKSNVQILKSGETIDLTEFKHSTTGFYCPLSNSETINFLFPDSKLFTFSRQDDGNNERYKLITSNWTDVTIKTDSSTFDTDDNSNTSNYFTPDNNVTINSGTKSHSFFIGSVGDGSPEPSNIILTAGNRVHIDNTRSDGINLTSFQVDGGSYIKKDVHIGGNLNISDSATILATEAKFNTDEVVFDNPLLLIGQNNTSNNLLGGIMNRYQDNSNNYKFTGLIKHNIGTKPYVLVNEVDANTNNNKDISSTDLDTVVTNSNNSLKNNYSNIHIDKLKSLSTSVTNNEDVSIYTRGSLGVTNNVYIGDTNHTNANIQIGSDTHIQYEKNNDGKLNVKTNVDLDLKAAADGSNLKSISYTSANKLDYVSSQKYTTNITTNLVETINNNLSYNMQGQSVETYKKDLHTKTNINKLTHHLPFYNNINSTSRTDVISNMDKQIDGTNHFYLTNNIIETFHKNKQINQNNLTENLKDFKHLTVTKDMTNSYKNNDLNIAKTQDTIVHSNNSETYVNINQTKHNNVNKIVGIDHNLNVSTNAILYSDNNILTYKKNLNDISQNTTSNITGNHDLFLNKVNDSEITGASSETYKKINDITISNNLNQVVSGNSNITGLNTTNIYKKGIINLTNGNDSKTIKNEYDHVLNKNLSEVYGANDSFNVAKNLTINYNNSLTEVYNSSYTSIIDRTATVATTTNYTVTVNNSKYLIDGVSQASLELQPNNIYVFNLNDNSLNLHPFLLSTTNNGTHNSGAVYSTNVVYNIDGSTVNQTNYLDGFATGSSRTLTLTPSAPVTLYYYCNQHSNMGGIISVIESTNIINITNNRNTTIGTGASTNIDSLVIGNKLDILYVGDSNETYKSDLVSTSNNYNINLSKQYNMICYNSTNTYNSDCTIKYDNNLIETISNITTSYRATGGNGNSVTMRECVVRISEANSSVHKVPNQYVPGDVVGSITLKKGDLILFDYTPGSGNTFAVTGAQSNFNADLAALNGIYLINDL